MLNAAEASLSATAEDDAERQRNRARLYAPPRQERGPSRRRGRPHGMGFDRAGAEALTAQLAAEDAQLGAGP